jgi:hypothetical protein
MNVSGLKIGFNILILITALMLALLWSVKTPPDSSDIWRFLNDGRFVWTEKSFDQPEPFSYAVSENKTWVSHGWLFGVLSRGLYQVGSIRALEIWRILNLVLIFVLSLAVAFRRQASPFSSALWSAVLVFSLSRQLVLDYWMVGAVMFALSVYIMEGPFWRSLFARWFWLAPVLAIWINLQPAALFFLPWLALWVATEFNSVSPEKPKFPLSAAILTILLLGLVFFLQPEGLKLPGQLLAGLGWAFNPLWQFEEITRWQNELLVLTAGAVFVIASVWVKKNNLSFKRDLFLFFFLSALSVYNSKFMIFLCIWAAPVIASRITLVFEALDPYFGKIKWIFKSGCLALILWYLAQSMLISKPEPMIYREPSPTVTLDFMRSQGLLANLFTERKWASVALWQLAPAVKIFMDERGPGVYASKERAIYNQIILAENDSFEELLKQTSTDAVLARLGSNLALRLGNSQKWQAVVFDNVSVLFVEKEKYPGLIKTHAPRGLKPWDLEQPFEPSRLLQSEADLEVRIKTWPQLGILYWIRALLLVEKKEPARARYWLETGLRQDSGFLPSLELLGDLRLASGDHKAAIGFWRHYLSLKDEPRVKEKLKKLKEN